MAVRGQAAADNSLQAQWPSNLRRQLNLTRELAFTQFKLKYTGSVLGYMWSLLKPLMVFAIMYFVFTRIFHVGSDTPHFTLQLLLGIVIWTFFAETISIAISTVVANANLIKKAYFPRPILVVASSLSALMTLGINMALIVTVAAFLKQVELGPQSLLFLPLLVELYLLILGLGLLLSALFVFYRDLGHLWEVGSQLLFYASAVIYPLSPTFLGGMLRILAMNPVAQVVEDIRHVLVTTKAPWTVTLLGPRLGFAPFAIVGIIVVTGYVSFRNLSTHFAENL